MTRRRWVYRDGVAHEVSLSYVPVANRPNTDSVLWNDRVYQDDGDQRWNSRGEHRQYMKDNDLSMHCDYTEFYKRKASEREAYFKGVDPQRRVDVANAVAQLEQRRR